LSINRTNLLTKKSKAGMESMFRQFEFYKDVAKSAVLYFKVKSESKTEVTGLGHGPYGFLEKGEG